MELYATSSWRRYVYFYQKGSKATLKIVQNEKNGFVKELYIQKKPNIDSHAFETQLQKTIEQLQESYPFLSVKNKK